MRAAAEPPPVEQRIMWRESSRDIVRVEDGDLGRHLEPAAAHHQTVEPGNDEKRGRAIGGGGYGPNHGRPVRLLRMTRQKRREMRLDPDRAHAWAAAAVRNAERLVQI